MRYPLRGGKGAFRALRLLRARLLRGKTDIVLDQTITHTAERRFSRNA